MSEQNAQGTPAWYAEELRALAGAITGRGVGICNGAALMLDRLAALAPSAPGVDIFAVQRIAVEYNLPFNGFAQALRAYLTRQPTEGSAPSVAGGER